MSENDFDVVMDELTNKAVGKLLKADVFDVSAFSVLRGHFWQKAERLQHETCISKQILMILRSAAAAIRSRAEYLPAVRHQLPLADDFEEMLDRLIAGDTRSDRTPTVPRIM